MKFAEIEELNLLAGEKTRIELALELSHPISGNKSQITAAANFEMRFSDGTPPFSGFKLDIGLGSLREMLQKRLEEINTKLEGMGVDLDSTKPFASIAEPVVQRRQRHIKTH